LNIPSSTDEQSQPETAFLGLAPFLRASIAGTDFRALGKDMLEMQHIVSRKDIRKGPTGALHTAIDRRFRLQRVFNNRHIENLFRDFGSIKFFLTRDNIREVLVVR